MRISDPVGKRLDEVTVRLEQEELTELLVATASLEEGSILHAMVRDIGGNTLALYRETGESDPLQRHFDWWMGPVVLAAAIFMLVGAYTIAKSIVGTLF